MMGALVMGIGIAGMIAGVAVSRSHTAVRYSTMALEGARAGIANVHRMLIRTPQNVVVGTCTTLPAGALAGVTVETCVTKNGAQYTVVSRGTARQYTRRLNGVIEIDEITGRVRLQSLYEI